METLTHSLAVTTCNFHLVSLDDDSLLSTETMAIFLERIFYLLGLHPDDIDIIIKGAEGVASSQNGFER